MKRRLSDPISNHKETKRKFNMPCDYKKYPSNWKTVIRPAILERANNYCEFCGLMNKSEGFRDRDGQFYSIAYIIKELESNGRDMFEDELLNCVAKDGKVKPIKIVLTIAHLNHDINDNDYSNLKALCQRCHNRHDIDHRKNNRKKSKSQLTIF